ncbi:MAG TPA: bifunctional DNA-formamidopyrimidine glycosylase/DNA-(apurinic or apyrimidinic site) lyase [Pseudomonadales bacterium]|jgi:formamidopyrimidine-DNA glycosylase|nr:bifunctional DNA-formamidopyrimidine glycosylase/DNA-(apurinic or apyrimidinic site) lyase [Pseudomonadales bacterium]HMU89818.1 bifunctional DNA-formamidopyrimidine glycosylase/DNA-(apurinic or apyrimidinic site) lyase [Pseudomonadales bacterium]HMW14949.1 bifunctional DNA-formamidopyrimidine glycosylase/DNA-(apurinic or apyrimidinic site) lyase [Pseudomonadales bacterium]HMW83258.1 bifunctional DNA-formamidopyrimidine glycosylase/DNA-(apurinic or apyrimidinic site) lyase [Pseudomonadales ba
MPELPEVETTLRGLAPHLIGRRIHDMVLRNGRLRWPIPDELPERLRDRRIGSLQRRAKYLLLQLDGGHLLLHLGMSGRFMLLEPPAVAPTAHDHYDLLLEGGALLRYRDPRRFGCCLWLEGDPLTHPLLSRLGPEPLGEAFDGGHLHRSARGRTVAIKSLLMQSEVVVGIGNIYANEALHRAGIDPRRPAGTLSHADCERLVGQIRRLLEQAITQGGTTLRDFLNSDGQAGYFGFALDVYGRTGQPCPRCGGQVASIRLNQRSTFFCQECQQ